MDEKSSITPLQYTPTSAISFDKDKFFTLFPFFFTPSLWKEEEMTDLIEVYSLTTNISICRMGKKICWCYLEFLVFFANLQRMEPRRDNAEVKKSKIYFLKNWKIENIRKDKNTELKQLNARYLRNQKHILNICILIVLTQICFNFRR